MKQFHALTTCIFLVVFYCSDGLTSRVHYTNLPDNVQESILMNLKPADLQSMRAVSRQQANHAQNVLHDQYEKWKQKLLRHHIVRCGFMTAQKKKGFIAGSLGVHFAFKK